MVILKLRLIECYIPKHIFTGIDKLIDNNNDIIWYNIGELNNSIIIRILTTLKNTESIIDMLNKEYGGSKFRIIVFEPTTTVPEVIEDNENDTKCNNENEKNEDNKNRDIENNMEKTQELERLCRQEIYDKVSEVLNASKEYYIMLTLSTIVAVVGILKNNVAIIISSMIIAPLLSPNIALSFSMSIADMELAKKSIKNLFFGIALVLALSIFLGNIYPISPDNPQILSRMNLGAMDVIIALCAGIVGALSTVSGISSVVVGVMIAVALLPPLVAFGLTLGAGYFDESVPILLLFLINIISINLSSSVVFYMYGISPYKWWEKEKAKRLTIFSITIWLILLFIVVVIVYNKF